MKWIKRRWKTIVGVAAAVAGVFIAPDSPELGAAISAGAGALAGADAAKAAQLAELARKAVK